MKDENSPIKLFIWRWWRSIDHQILLAVFILISASILLVTTAGSSVASRIGMHEDYFSNKHFIYVTLSIIALIFFSCLSIDKVKKIGIILFAINFLFLILVKFYGYEVKGAKRWVNILGFSLQPSEFIKPFFAIITAQIFSLFQNRNISLLVSAIIFLVTAILLIIQPDLGMLVTLSGIWGIQLFIAGLPIIWIVGALFTIIVGMFLAYNLLPHVAARIDSFIDPSGHENYQVEQSIKAFKHGGFFGTGPGEGVVKNNIPDSHADFIFSVAGEEFGSVICIFLSLVFAFIVLRGILLLIKQKDEFIVLSCSGIIAQFALQSIINMGVSLNLLPTKGMTLPFVSYGGTSTIAVGASIGMLLALSKISIEPQEYNILKKIE